MIKKESCLQDSPRASGMRKHYFPFRELRILVFSLIGTKFPMREKQLCENAELYPSFHIIQSWFCLMTGWYKRTVSELNYMLLFPKFTARQPNVFRYAFDNG